ncbi:unnamed protein product [Owenia fusiformis]|uniref:Uncharacterized protein n=1 Tax=Owenia fusiformis TaxID=6347 RepID=A0A8J1XWC7_OWEFU|nr:unnamed protein product [Owenia fusiformis]
MSEEVFKAPKSAKRTHGKSSSTPWSPGGKRRRTKDDFYSFCSIVLAYTQYEAMRAEDIRAKNNSSPLDSSGSTIESLSSDSNASSTSSYSPRDELRGNEEMRGGVEDGEQDLITCFCMKPYGGRPMIECDECEMWIHLSCAKIRKNNIPDTYICQSCRDSKTLSRKSNRQRTENKRIST